MFVFFIITVFIYFVSAAFYLQTATFRTGLCQLYLLKTTDWLTDYSLAGGLPQE